MVHLSSARHSLYNILCASSNQEGIKWESGVPLCKILKVSTYFHTMVHPSSARHPFYSILCASCNQRGYQVGKWCTTLSNCLLQSQHIFTPWYTPLLQDTLSIVFCVHLVINTASDEKVVYHFVKFFVVYAYFHTIWYTPLLQDTLFIVFCVHLVIKEGIK